MKKYQVIAIILGIMNLFLPDEIKQYPRDLGYTAGKYVRNIFRQPERYISTRHYEDRSAVCSNPLNVSVSPK